MGERVYNWWWWVYIRRWVGWLVGFFVIVYKYYIEG